MTHVKLEKSQGLDLSKIDSCIGDPEADVENPVLKLEQDAQLIPGKLDKGAVLKAICSGFEETTEPAVCLTDEIETNECLENNGGCRQNKAANITACKIVYIFDQVRALEDEMLLRIKRQGLDITPQILIVTRLLPDASGTTCGQHLEKVAGYAIGGGHVLHMVCDLTIAVDNAIFGQTGPKIISAVTGGFTDLSFDVVGYAWQIVNCICTVSYSLTMCQVMDTAKQSTRSGSLNEVSMSFLNNTLSLPFALFLIFMFNEWEFVHNSDVIRLPMFWVVATASGLLGLAISFTSIWFLNQTGPTTYRSVCRGVLCKGQNVLIVTPLIKEQLLWSGL